MNGLTCPVRRRPRPSPPWFSLPCLILLLAGLAPPLAAQDCVVYDGTMTGITLDVWNECYSDGGISNYLTGFEATGNYAALTGRYDEMSAGEDFWWIEFYDISDPLEPDLLRFIMNTDPSGSLSIQGLGSHYAFYAACYSGGTLCYQRILDLENPTATATFPFDGGKIPVGELCYSWEYDGASTTTFRAVDLSGWPSFPELDSLVLAGQVIIGRAQSGLVYLLMLDRTLHVVDVGDPGDIAVVWSMPLTDADYRFDVGGSIGAYGTAPDAVQLLDLTDPAAPVPIGSPLAMSSTISSLGCDGSRLYTGVVDDGVLVHDVGDPAAPVYRGKVEYAGWSYLWFAAGHLLVKNGCDINILPLDCISTGIGGEDLPRTPATGFVRIHPNPFNPRTTLTFALARSGPVELGIYDLQGRLVRSLASGAHEAGEHTLLWNGTDDRGRALPSGVYLARFAGEGRSDARKLVLAR
jgi:hypothetical protein